MATLDEILAFSADDPTDYIHDDIQFKIDNDLRTITLNPKGVVIGVVGDKNVNHVNFVMPRWYNGFDMSEFEIRINYVNANNSPNYYPVTDAIIEGDNLLFTWLVDSDATAYKGTVVFTCVLFKQSGGVVSQAFNTTLARANVLEGLAVDGYVDPDVMHDIISTLTEQLNAEVEQIRESLPDDYTTLVNRLDTFMADLATSLAPSGAPVPLMYYPGYIKTNASPVDLNAVFSNAEYRHAVAKCAPGDIFSISALGGSAPRTWAILDADFAVLSASASNANCNERITTIPENGAYLVINDRDNRITCRGLTGIASKGPVDTNAELVWNEGMQLNSDGSVSAAASHNRIVTDLIYVKKGAVIAVKDDYAFNIARCTAYRKSLLEYRAMSTDPFEVMEDCYIRIGMKAPGSGIVIDTAMAQEHLIFKAVTKTFGTDSIGVPIVDAVGQAYTRTGEVPAHPSNVAGLYALYDQLAAAYPTYFQRDAESLGKDQSGTYDIWSYTLDPRVMTYTNYQPVLPQRELHINLLAGIHPMEITSLMGLYVFVKDLLERHFQNDTLNMLWNNCIFHIVPVINPWGYNQSPRKRGNSRNVDINRNFDANWTTGSDAEYGTTFGTAPESEAETQAIVAFLREHSDALLTLNIHNGNIMVGSSTTSSGNPQGNGYVTSSFIGDIYYGLYAARVIDSEVRKAYPDVMEYVPEFNDHCMFYSYRSLHQGTMDRWYNSIGMHGYLLETAPQIRAGVTDDGFIKNNTAMCIGNLLGTCVRFNQDLLSDDRMFVKYTHILE